MLPEIPATTTIEGRIERITFHSPQTHFMVARFRVAGHQKPVTVVGHLPEPRPGETLRLKGDWKQHPKYGAQFQVLAFDLLLPAEVEEIRKYLSAGLIKGIGAKTAERLIRHFQADTLTIIETQPHRLAEVKGIGADTAQRIGEAWKAHHAVRTLMQFLQDNQVKPAYAARIFKVFGQEAMEVLRNDPYRLAAEMPRIGFYIADAIVRQTKLPICETVRAKACIGFLLEEGCEEGHMYVPRDQLLERCSTDFDLDYHKACAALEELAAEDRIRTIAHAPDGPVYLTPLYSAESEITRRIQAKLSLPQPPVPLDGPQIMAAVVKRLAIQLSRAQLEVLQSVLSQRVVIITGGPGTGKTTLIRSIAALFEAMGRRCLLAAPTGRAARRVAEVTCRPAATLHKLLGFTLAENQFERGQDDPLDTDALIVDEASMVDALLMGHLIKALPLPAALVLVGDASQLPSVGPGTVLADLIKTGILKTFELNEVFRQASQSPIITRAHDVRQGRLPELIPLAPGAPLDAFSFIECAEPLRAARTLVALCADGLSDAESLDPIRQVQVLTPMHKGEVGTLQLNPMLQAALNPQAPGAKALAGRFYLNDKVMHLRNNYLKEVFNGEIGIVCEVDLTAGTLAVDYDGRRVTYEEADLDDLTLAYAISVHKSQGSEYPVVILPLVTQHYVMLQRNLLYTALTRAQRMVILVGSLKAVRIAVETDKPRLRRSLLGWRLMRR